MKRSQQRLVVVLGMHRSGTSAITHGLSLLGVGLGSDLHPAGFDNPKGFWEDRGVLEINEELLRLQSSAYDRLGLAPDSLPINTATSSLKLKASQLLLERLAANGGRWGFKDPRTCRLLSFWSEIFMAIDCRVSFVIVLRNPASVAASLGSRNETPTEKSYWLWLQHMLPALRQTQGTERVLVDYDEFMDAPYAQLARIAHAIDLPLPAADAQQVRDFEGEFLETSLRHTRYSATQLELDSRAPATVCELYRLLSATGRDELALDGAELNTRLAILNDGLSATGPLIDYVNALEDGRIGLWQELAQRDQHLNHLQAALDEKDSELATLVQQASQHEAQVLAQHVKVGERSVRVEELLLTLAQRDGRIAALENEAVERDMEINALQPNAAATEALAVRDQQIQALRLNLEQHETQILGLHHAVGVRDDQIADLKHQVATQANELSSIVQSKSWLITKPMRFGRRVAISRPSKFLSDFISQSSQSIWHMLPLSAFGKRRFKDHIFKNYPAIFGQSKAYKAWINFNADPSDTPRGEVVTSSVLSTVDLNDYVPITTTQSLSYKPAKLICFYLPQFHAIPENDEWWGKGFTEWSNVRPAQPHFLGHYQPHVPGELGYYNVLDAGVQKRQVELAKLYGLGGFCFYFYWFDGKRLLETPIANYLADKSLDLPFCLCWANENWSRRWDGLDSEILIAQNYSADDDLAFIRHVSQYMLDSRYIRVDEKPLLIVYRPSLLPSPKETVLRWRNWCRLNGIGEIYLAYTQSFEAVDPSKYDFDAAIEFPPNNSAPPNVTDQVAPIHKDFGTTVYDWRIFVERSKKYSRQNYTLFRSVCPSWDNTARKKNRGTVFLNSNPALYEEWLKNAIVDTQQAHTKDDEKLIFVNAWNEWAEGAHLEPDEKFGYAWLQATKNALVACGGETATRKIVVVSHDAHPHGAQYLALNLARVLSSDFGFKVDLVLLGKGILSAEYAKWATIHDLSEAAPQGEEAKALANWLAQKGHEAAIVNTTVSGLFLEKLQKAGLRCVSLVHELEGVIKDNKLEQHATKIAQNAHAVVFAAEHVAQSFQDVVEVSISKKIIRPQGLYKKNKFGSTNIIARNKLRENLNLNRDTQIILAVGYADHRKGVDLFVDIGLEILKTHPEAYFVWVGHRDSVIQANIDAKISSINAQSHFLFVGRKADTDMYYAGADLYAMTSREDPFPSVVIEAMAVGLPVVGFRGAGGFENLLDQGCGVLVEKDDTIAYAASVCELLDSPESAVELGRIGAAIVDKSFSFRHYVYDLLDFAEIPLKRISAVVPNFNYAKYLPQRLDSILKQSYPIFELIVLDDCSTDNSLELIEEFSKDISIDLKIHINEKNSGSVFKQWEKGLSCAQGDYVWICEADDIAAPNFVESLVDAFENEDVVLAYTQSCQINEKDILLKKNYLEYTKDASSLKWNNDYVCAGSDELNQALCIKNTIPNVSAVLFSANSLREAFAESQMYLGRLKVAGDWLIYINALKQGHIAFVAESLNFHRRHDNSATITALSKLTHLSEIIFLQNYVLNMTYIDELNKTKAEAYVKKIYTQFGLDVKYKNAPKTNPEIIRELERISSKALG